MGDMERAAGSSKPAAEEESSSDDVFRTPPGSPPPPDEGDEDKSSTIRGSSGRDTPDTVRPSVPTAKKRAADSKNEREQKSAKVNQVSISVIHLSMSRQSITDFDGLAVACCARI